ncbi:MAG: polyketide synthase dehydratase domain-containing protein, partial [Candidatus Methylomirabilis sp.]
LEYGPAFQGIERLWQGQGEALAAIRIPEMVAGDLRDYQFHPALIDYCFQAMLGTLLAEGADRKGTVYLPVKLERMRVYGRPGSRMYCHARLTERDASGLEGDILLCDEDGNVLIEFQGFRCQALEGTRADILEDLDDWLYEFKWQPVQPPVEPGDRVGEAIPSLHELPHQSPGSWLIFADKGGVGRKLAELLTSHGQRPILISPGEASRRIDQTHFEVCPERAESMVELLDQLKSDHTDCRGVIHLWSLDAAPPDETTRASLESAQSLGAVSVLHLVQALAKADWTNPTRLWLVTRGAQAVEPGVDSAAIAQSPLWGLGRVIINEEHPHLRCRLVDLSAGDSAREIRLLFDELCLDDAEEEIAFRDGLRYVHRLNRVPAAQPVQYRARKQAAEDQPFHLEISKPGLLDALTLRETGRQAPASGEVEIRVHATGLNFRDVMKAMGIYPTEENEKLWLGDECAGRIVAVGEGVAGFKVGDEVIAVAPGCFSAFITTSATLVVPKPAQLSFEEAATIPIVFLTVYYALHYL